MDKSVSLQCEQSKLTAIYSMLEKGIRNNGLMALFKYFVTIFLSKHTAFHSINFGNYKEFRKITIFFKVGVWKKLTKKFDRRSLDQRMNNSFRQDDIKMEKKIKFGSLRF